MSDTASTWVRRFREQGVLGLRDRSSRPMSPARKTAQALANRMKELRLERGTMRQIATETSVGLTIVRRILPRRSMNRLKDFDPPPPARRYEESAPGKLIHLDIKKLGRTWKAGHKAEPDPGIPTVPLGRR